MRTVSGSPFRAKLKDLGYNDYSAYLRSSHWRRIKLRYTLEVKPDGCALCPDPVYQLHHKTYERLGAELLSDLCPLCQKCHTRVHMLYREGRLSSLDPQRLIDKRQITEMAAERKRAQKRAAKQAARAAAQAEKRLANKEKRLRNKQIARKQKLRRARDASAAAIEATRVQLDEASATRFLPLIANDDPTTFSVVTLPPAGRPSNYGLKRNRRKKPSPRQTKPGGRPKRS